MTTEVPIDCAKNGNLQSLKEYRVKDLIYARDSDRMSLLLHAAACGHLDIVQYLHEAGSNVHMRENTDGLNAVHLAAKSGHKKVVEYLVNTANCHLEAKSASGRTAFRFAVEEEHIDMADFIHSKAAVQYDDELSSMFYEAVRRGCRETVQYLLVKFQIDVNKKNLEGNTPVHYAAMSGHFDILYNLVENYKADPSVQNNKLRTPLHYAAQGGYLDITMYLVESVKLSTEVKDASGCTPYELMKNSFQSTSRIISKFLLKYKSSQ